MLTRMRPRLSYANVMSSIAIFAVLGGGVAWAHGKIGTKDLRKNAVTTPKIKNAAVTRAKLRNNSVNARKLAPGVGGPPAVTSREQERTAPPFDFADFDVRCPRGMEAVGIGQGLGALEPVFFASYGRGALGSMFNPSNTQSFSGIFYVECVEARRLFASAARSVPQMPKQQALEKMEAAKQDALSAE